MDVDMFRRFFRKEKAIAKPKKYMVIVRWYHDTPWYLSCTMGDIEKFRANSEVRVVEVIG